MKNEKRIRRNAVSNERLVDISMIEMNINLKI